MVLGRWGATILLTACFALAYIDRQVMSLIVTPIKASLQLSDARIGLLQGISFSLFYVIASLPLARLADRGDRARLAAACVAVWSLMTAACGLAQSFWHLLAARTGLAMAEAGLPSAALTLMADLHDSKGLARATSIFMLAPFVGGGLALLAGGAIYASLAGATLPAGMEPWQVLFMLAGLPGLLLAPALLFLLRDPRVAGVAAAGASVRDLYTFVIANRRFCIPYILALALIVMVLNAHVAWMPTAILRRFPVGEAAMGAGFGMTYLVAGSVATLAAGAFAARGEPEGVLGRVLGQMRVSAVLLAVSAAAAPFMPGYWSMIVMAGVAVFFTSAVVSMGSIPLQLTSPKPLRAQMIALSTLTAALLGTGLGPIAVGLVSDWARTAGFAEPLSAALALIGGFAASAAALLLFVTRTQAEPSAANPRHAPPERPHRRG
jgi:MFS family permease